MLFPFFHKQFEGFGKNLQQSVNQLVAFFPESRLMHILVIGWSLQSGMILAYESGSRLMEPDRQVRNFPRVEQFQNWFIASAPGNPILHRALDIIREKFIWKVQKTVDLTGPGTLSDAAHEFLATASLEQGISGEISRRTNYSKKFTFPSETLYESGNQTVWLMGAGRVGAHLYFGDDPVSGLLQHTYAASWKPPGMTRFEVSLNVRRMP